MHPYSLRNYKTSLICILYRLILLQATQQISLHRRDVAEEPSSIRHQDLSYNRTFVGPVIVLMSSDTVSIAQLPMILYGNLTEIYKLTDEQLGNETLTLGNDENEREDARSVEDDDDDSSHDRKTFRRNGPPADAREFEQMPHQKTTNVNTTTSLGKSEWQQIAAGDREQSEALLHGETGKKVARGDRLATAEETKEDGDEPHLGRPRRSNSLNDHDDSSGTGKGTSAVGAEPSSTQEGENHTSGRRAEAGNQHAPGTAQESGQQNVTSAAFGVSPLQKQQNPAAADGDGAAPAEEDDKISRSSSATFSSSQLRPSTSSPATSSDGAPSSNRVRFSDFDVHMALGYAFVADSAGRIHRIKLPVASKSNSASRRRVGLQLKRYESLGLKGTVSNSESVAIVNDETTTNMISNAGNHSRVLPGVQSKVVDANESASISTDITSNVARLDANHRDGSVGFAADAPSVGHASSTQETPYDDVNKVGSGQSSVTHEHTKKESQHPAISGDDQNDLSDSIHSDSLVSGTLERAEHEARQGFVSGNLEHVDDVKPTIIWSRSKHVRRPISASGRLQNNGDSQSTKQRASQQLANDDGALPRKEKINQLDGAAQTALKNGRQTAAGRAQPLVASGGGCSGDESRDRLGSGAKTTDQRFATASNTEIAVDWLNNLLFVLDNCRLLVMDFDGNNELVLIDDFNSNSRPVDIKLDPIHDSLFWLQVGKFHNTIYKLDLNVLSMKSAQKRLVKNVINLRLVNERSTSAAHDGLDFDLSELIPLVSHHYAHPIITNLPRHARLFTIDHKNSRIYVPLSPSSSAMNSNSKEPLSLTSSGSDIRRDDAEIFASPTNDITHLNNTLTTITDSPYPMPMNVADCNHMGINETQTMTETNDAQILAYNLDGTDVGPFRTSSEKSHISSLEELQDMTLNSEDGLLYWLVNDGRDLFEEFRENSSIQPAQHHLFGKSYSKLIYFDDNDANQPMTLKTGFNVRKIIHSLSLSIASNRQTREPANGSNELLMGLRNSPSDIDTSRNAPYIILGVTCLVVVTVYLIYSLIFQRLQARPRTRCHSGVNHGGGVESISGDSSIGSDGSQPDDNINGFVNSTTISRWVGGAPPSRGTDASTFDRDIATFDRRFGSYDLESTNYEASNAIDEHYRGSTLNGLHEQLAIQPKGRLANLSEWPTNIHDLSNKLYVPVEVLQDEALSSIQRVSIDQLEIERTAPLGEGHFGTVLQGTIDCTKYSLLDTRQRGMVVFPSKAPISPDSLAPPHSNSRLFAPSTSSSGHGSSSSTSCEFATANTDSAITTNRDDYLTPKNQLGSTASDYEVEMPASTSTQDGSCSGYCDAQAVRSFRTTPAALVGNKLKVAIKKLKDNASLDEKRDFLQEAKLLANFNHPNIVHLIGICLDRGSTLIIMELMLGGDLIRYMQENTPSQANNYSDDLTYDDLLKICLDIANGCCYLEDMDYIHRDLAARNCLVSSRKREERVVKLADFGLARDIYKDSYYKKLNDSAMPLKWMAPESLSEQKFTKKSDVWSFGVVMWEVLSYCQEKPYSGIEPFLMKVHLEGGARLRKPDCCDDSMYRLMNQCWQVEPDNRPTFHECRAMLIEIRNIGRL